MKSQGAVVTKPDEIAESFAEFYKSLYQIEDTCCDDAEFLNHTKLAELTDSAAKKLDKLIEE